MSPTAVRIFATSLFFEALRRLLDGFVGGVPDVLVQRRSCRLGGADRGGAGAGHRIEGVLVRLAVVELGVVGANLTHDGA
ncbi:MAG: hypothetical protein ABWY21_13765 [Rhodococcus sp. (in: high G+C Gram-positive bacteria)]